MPLQISCTNEEKIRVTAAPVTKHGNPAQLDGALRVSVVSGDGSFTQDDADPLAFFAVSGSNPGDTTFLVEGDADLGEGQQLIQDTVTLSVVGANAAAFGLVASPAEPK